MSSQYRPHTITRGQPITKNPLYDAFPESEKKVGWGEFQVTHPCWRGWASSVPQCLSTRLVRGMSVPELKRWRGAYIRGLEDTVVEKSMA